MMWLEVFPGCNEVRFFMKQWKYFLVHILLFFLSLVYCSFAFSLNFPNRALTYNELSSVLSLLGPGTAPRLLSVPYPLGGFQGLEVSLSRHYVPTKELKNLGADEQDEFSYPLLTMAKGLFYNVDFSASFVPFAQRSDFLHFSSELRWMFYEAPELPFFLSGLVNLGTSTFNNMVSVQNWGVDVVGAVILNPFSFYLGLGQLTSRGLFMGFSNGLTQSELNESLVVSNIHQFFGVDVRYGSFFTALQLDRYQQDFYSVKLGYRF